MWLLMNDGARNARLNDTRNVCVGVRLDHERRPRREHRVVDRRELVDAAADHPAEVVAEEDLVLHVGAALVAVVAVGRQRDVERVVPEVAAVASATCCVPIARDVAGLEVERLGVEAERQELRRSARAPAGSTRRRSAGW